MKKRLTLTLSDDIIKLLKQMAKARNFTVSQLVEGIFSSMVAEEEANDKTTTNKYNASPNRSIYNRNKRFLTS